MGKRSERPRPKNKKGNQILTRKEYLELLQQDAERGTSKIDMNSVGEGVYEFETLKRGGDFSNLDKLSRLDAEDYFKRYPNATETTSFRGLPNDQHPLVSGTRFFANTKFGDYDDYKEDVPDMVQSKGIDLLSKDVALAALDRLKSPKNNDTFAPKRKSRGNYKPKGKRDPEEFNYKRNRVAKGSITNRRRYLK